MYIYIFIHIYIYMYICWAGLGWVSFAARCQAGVACLAGPVGPSLLPACWAGLHLPVLACRVHPPRPPGGPPGARAIRGRKGGV